MTDLKHARLVLTNDQLKSRSSSYSAGLQSPTSHFGTDKPRESCQAGHAAPASAEHSKCIATCDAAQHSHCHRVQSSSCLPSITATQRYFSSFISLPGVQTSLDIHCHSHCRLRLCGIRIAVTCNKTVWACRPTRNDGPAIHSPRDQGGALCSSRYILHFGRVLRWKCFPYVGLYFCLLFCCSCFLLRKESGNVLALLIHRGIPRVLLGSERELAVSDAASGKGPVSSEATVVPALMVSPSAPAFCRERGKALRAAALPSVGKLGFVREATILGFLPKNKLSQFPKFNRGHGKLFFSVMPILLVQNYQQSWQ